MFRCIGEIPVAAVRALSVHGTRAAVASGGTLLLADGREREVKWRQEVVDPRHIKLSEKLLVVAEESGWIGASCAHTGFLQRRIPPTQRSLQFHTDPFFWENFSGTSASFKELKAGDYDEDLEGWQKNFDLSADFFRRNFSGEFECYEHDRGLLVGKHQATVVLWDMFEGIGQMKNGHGGVVSCGALYNNWVVTGCESGEVRFWNHARPSADEHFPVLQHPCGIQAVSLGEKMLAVATEMGVTLWSFPWSGSDAIEQQSALWQSEGV